MVDVNAFYNGIENSSGWTLIVMDDYSHRHTDWLVMQGLVFGDDYKSDSWREPHRDINTHLWSFKDPNVAMLFALKFS